MIPALQNPLPADIPAQYSAYGLRIASDIALPELAPVALSGPADLVIRRADLTLPKTLTDQPQAEHFGPDGVDLWWSTVGGFRLPHTTPEILVDALPGVDDDLLTIGQVLGFSGGDHGHDAASAGQNGGV